MINTNIRKLVKKLGIVLLFSSDIRGRGYIVKVKNVTFLCVNATLSDEEQDNVITHEIGHYLDKLDIGDYKNDDVVRCHSEHNANSYLINRYSAEYVDKVDEDQANYVDFAKSIGIDDVDLVKSILARHYRK